MRTDMHLGKAFVLALALTTVAAAASPAQQSTATPEPATLQQMYDAGADFDTFLARAESRKALWNANWDKSDPADEFVDRARALAGNYRLLAVAVDSCSDSVNTIPYIARLAAQVDGLDLQIVDSDQGALLMELYRTPDDRGATPTVVILNEDYEVVGTWVERPSPLQDWWVSHPEIRISEKARRKQGWYDWDEGYTTYAEIVGLLEVADSER